MTWRGLIPFSIVAAAVVAAVELLRRRRLRRFSRRGCMGRAWRRRFPDASKADIRLFLGTIADALALPRLRPLAFSPDDTPLAVYRALYAGGQPDAMELETLAALLERRYRLPPGDWSPGGTLGALFQRTRQEGTPR